MAPQYDAKKDLAVTPAFQKLGYFSEMGYLRPGKADLGLNLPESCKGKQMIPGDGHIKDGTNMGYFNEFVRGFDGDKYVDRLTVLRRSQIAKKKKNLHGVFNSMCPAKTMNGRGMLYGTFIDVDDYEAFSPLKKEVRKAKTEPRGFFTNPGKKGTGYGYVDVCFDKYPEHSVNKTKPVQRERLASTMKDRSPFYERTHTSGFFDPNPYAPYKSGPEYRMRYPKVKTLEKPFYPCAAPKKPGNNHDGCFSPFPSWTPGKYEDEKTTRKPYVKPKIFMPLNGPKSTRTNSIHRQFIQKEINGKNCRQIMPVVYAPTLNKK